MFNGFDPMKAESINDSTVLHSTLLKLNGDQNSELFITSWPVITYYARQIWFIKRVVLFVPEDEFDLSDRNRIVIKNSHLLINWKGSIKEKSENELLFICE